MKKLFIALLCLMLACLCTCGQGVPPTEGTAQGTIRGNTSQTATTSEALTEIPSTVKIDPSVSAIYSDAIIKYYDLPRDSLNAGADYYFLYDIDGDGTQELLLGEVGLNGMTLITVYVIHDGAAVLQEEYWGDSQRGSPALLYKNGTLKEFDDYDDKMFTYYRFEDGKLKFKTRLFDHYSEELNSGDYSRKDGIHDKGRVITKEEFERTKKEFEGDGQTVGLDWKLLAEYGG